MSNDPLDNLIQFGDDSIEEYEGTVSTCGWDEISAWRPVKPYCLYCSTDCKEMKGKRTEKRKKSDILTNNTYLRPDRMKGKQAVWSQPHVDKLRKLFGQLDPKLSIFGSLGYKQHNSLRSYNVLSYEFPSWRQVADVNTYDYVERLELGAMVPLSELNISLDASLSRLYKTYKMYRGRQVDPATFIDETLAVTLKERRLRVLSAEYKELLEKVALQMKQVSTPVTVTPKGLSAEEPNNLLSTYKLKVPSIPTPIEMQCQPLRPFGEHDLKAVVKHVRRRKKNDAKGKTISKIPNHKFVYDEYGEVHEAFYTVDVETSKSDVQRKEINLPSLQRKKKSHNPRPTVQRERIYFPQLTCNSYSKTEPASKNTSSFTSLPPLFGRRVELTLPGMH